MKCNVGKTDRAARIVAGLVFLGLGYYYQSWWGLVGLVPLTTGALAWCPVYIPFGIATNKKDTK